VTGVRPPRVPTRLLELLLPEESREAVIGDLVEAFEEDVGERPLTAHARYWREACVALVTLQLVPDRIPAYTPDPKESRMQSFVSDLRLAIRVLSRSRAFTVICVLTLGIAIGATTAIFSIVNPVLLRPLPYPDADRLVIIEEQAVDGTGGRLGFSTYADLRRGARSLVSSAAFADWQPTLFGDQDSERLQGQRVGADYFRTLGVRPFLGRDFLPSDDTPDNSNVVILSHGLWTRRFGADPSVVGSTIDLSGVKREVIGVMPASFDNVTEANTQLWRVLGYAEGQPWACRTCRHLQAIGRLRDGVTGGQAAQELNAVMGRIVAEHPKDYAASGVLIPGLQDRVTRNARPVFLAILGAVGLVLLIAVANVVNLQLARAVRRQEEFAVRAALGAGRGRIAQQLLAEGLVLAASAGAVGVCIAALTLPALLTQLPEGLPRLAAVTVDWRVLLLVGAIVLAAGVVLGMVPAAQAGRRTLFDTLRGSGRAVGASHHRTRSGLVIGEVALAMMLLVGAALLGRSLMRLLDVDMGFDARNVVSMEVQATGAAYEQPGSILANHDRIRQAVLAVPGVIGVGLTSQLPLGGNMDRYGTAVRDKPLENPEMAPEAERYGVSWDYLRAMRIPVVRGRAFTEAEANDSSVRVAVVSDAFARRVWPGEDPVGKYIRMSGESRPWWRVIGVVGNVRHTGLDASMLQQVYVPERQWFFEESAMMLVVRTSVPAAQMISSIRTAVRSVDPIQPISKVATMDHLVSRSTAQRRLGLMLFVAFGIIALLLATAGIYGVLAGSVAERTREFGVRSALGATPSSLVGLVLRQGAVLATAGLAVGVLVALALSRYLRTMLFAVGTTDPISIGAAVAVILVVALAACLVPALRATRVDPMAALRSS
jgi:putative ABC transport system permease protein